MEPMPNTPVLIGPRWVPGTVLYTDPEGIHVILEDGDCKPYAPEMIALRGDAAKPKRGQAVLVEEGERWVEGHVLDLKRGLAFVNTATGEHWLPSDSIACLLGAPKSEAKPSAALRGGSEAGELQQTFGTRWIRFGWRYGALLVLGFALFAPLISISAHGSWQLALAWVAVHVVLATYVLAANRPLPRFHAAGIGKPTEPHVNEPGLAVEHSPTRGKWEVTVMLLGSWMIIGLGSTLPGFPPWIAQAYVVTVGGVVAALAYFSDRHSAAEARRLLAAKPMSAAAVLDEVRVEGKLDAPAERERPPVWREVMLYSWSSSQQVTKTITDSNGNTQTVQATETSHYSCGLRRESDAEQLELDTPLGRVEVPLRGAIWAAERDMSFGRMAGKTRHWDKRSKSYKTHHHCQAAAFEDIRPGDGVIVIGKIERQRDGSGRMAGGASGPIVAFAARADPSKRLSAHLLRRRVLIGVMIGVGLAPLLALLITG